MSKRDRSIANMRSEAQRIYYQRQKIKRLEKENKQLKDNWNKLKKDLELVVDYGLGDESSKWDKIYGEYAKSTLKFMQELERSDNK